MFPVIYIVVHLCVCDIHQLDQKGSEQKLVDAYGQTVNSAGMNQLK